MQLVRFVTKDTKDENKILVWCTTNKLITFRDFMQYVLDNVNNPEDFMIIDTKKRSCIRHVQSRNRNVWNAKENF